MKVATMKQQRKRRFNKHFNRRLEQATRRITREVNAELDRIEYQQQRRELNQRLRELCNQLAARTIFTTRQVNQDRSVWSITELFRLKSHDDRRYFLTQHGHLVYDAYWTRKESQTINNRWEAWRKVRYGNPHVTNRQMMTLIRKLEKML